MYSNYIGNSDTMTIFKKSNCEIRSTLDGRYLALQSYTSVVALVDTTRKQIIFGERHAYSFFF